jgi:hypothetical protein
MCAHGYIDEVSSRVFARFYEYETWSARDSFQRDVKSYGIIAWGIPFKENVKMA